MQKDQVEVALVRLQQDEDRLLQIFFDELDRRSSAFFDYINLSRPVSWGAFRRRYDCGGAPDIERVNGDLAGMST